jgi:hypothetical protein
MKKIFTLVWVLPFLSLSSFSQEIHFGIKGGADMRKIDGALFKEKFSFGYHLGGFVQLSLTKSIIFQPEVYFSQTSYDSSDNFHVLIDSASRVKNLKLGYLNIPLLLGLKVNERIMLQAGPQFGILMNQSQKLTSNGEDAIKKGDFSLVAGIQVNAMSFVIYGRYIIGLSDASNIDLSQAADKSSWKSQTIHLGVGLRF